VVLAQQTEERTTPPNVNGEKTTGEQTAAPAASEESSTTEFTVGEVLVKFRPGARGQDIANAHRQSTAREKEAIPGINVRVVDVPSGQEDRAVELYEHNPNVLYAERNAIYYADETKEETNGKAKKGTAEAQTTDGAKQETTTDAGSKETTEATSNDVTTSAVSNDPQFAKQWGFNNTGANGWKKDADIDAVEAWNKTYGSTWGSLTAGSGAKIAIVDTGINPSHPDLQGQVLSPGSNCARDEQGCSSVTPLDDNGHGTHVAGTAGAKTNNSTGVAGTCGACALYSVKVLNKDGAGKTSWVAKGITEAANKGTKAINLSLGGSVGSQALNDAVNYAWNKQVLLAAAAGNSGSGSKRYPAAYSNVIAVSATDQYDRKASFSNHGNWVDVAAPGVGILSTTRDGKYESWSGTSMATPHVAGLAGLLWSTSYGTSNTSVRNRIQQQADHFSGTGSVNGRINACKAVGSSCSYG
jgi:thermitase